MVRSQRETVTLGRRPRWDDMLRFASRYLILSLWRQVVPDAVATPRGKRDQTSSALPQPLPKGVASPTRITLS
jgi:hypothetical protein